MLVDCLSGQSWQRLNFSPEAICRLTIQKGRGTVYASIKEHNRWTKFDPDSSTYHYDHRKDVVPIYEVWVRIVDRLGNPETLGTDYQLIDQNYIKHHCHYFKIVCWLIGDDLTVRTSYASSIPLPPVLPSTFSEKGDQRMSE